MDSNYDEKVRKHSRGYNIAKKYIHPIVVTEDLSISVRSFLFLRRICKNVNSVLANVKPLLLNVTARDIVPTLRRLKNYARKTQKFILRKFKTSLPRVRTSPLGATWSEHV